MWTCLQGIRMNQNWLNNTGVSHRKQEQQCTRASERCRHLWPPLHPCSGLHSCCRKPTSYLVKGHSADLAARKETNTSSVPCLNCTFVGTQTDAPWTWLLVVLLQPWQVRCRWGQGSQRHSGPFYPGPLHRWGGWQRGGGQSHVLRRHRPETGRCCKRCL